MLKYKKLSKINYTCHFTSQLSFYSKLFKLFIYFLFMQRCPNCSYKLVLLSSRLKYKCSLCSKLFPQKEIDNKEFREWNKFQRQLDLETLKLKKLKLTKEEKLQKRKLYYKNNKEKLKELQRRWMEKNREFYNKIKRNYWNRKTEQLNVKRRERYNKKKEMVLNYQERWQQNNSYKYIIKRRLADLREQQRNMALKVLNNNKIIF